MDMCFVNTAAQAPYVLSGGRTYHLWPIAEIGEEAVQADLRPVEIASGAWQACFQASAS